MATNNLSLMHTNELNKPAIPDIQYGFRPSLFMWPGISLFLGRLSELGLHSMGAVTLNVGLYAPFLMKTADGKIALYRAAIIPAGCKHELFAGGNVVASLMIEKNSSEYLGLKKRIAFSNTHITDATSLDCNNCFQLIYEEKPPKVEVYQSLRTMLQIDNHRKGSLDPRIETAMQMISLNPGENLHQEYLASLANLSTSRFRHLFRKQSGLSFRRYRIWQRVLFAMDNLHKADNLTQAAFAAGFADSAHFSRCFRDTFGIKPSIVFRNIDRFEVSSAPILNTRSRSS